MTRINLVEPHQLTDKHLMAEELYQKETPWVNGHPMITKGQGLASYWLTPAQVCS